MDKSKLIEQYIECVFINDKSEMRYAPVAIKKLFSDRGYEISDQEIGDLLESSEFKKLQDIRYRYTSKKSASKSGNKEWGFKDFKAFYLWFINQPQNGEACFYCGTTQETLQSLFGSGKITAKKTSHTATLQLERKDSAKGYSEDNCVLACSLCNNAKSDMISSQNYQTYLAKAMGQFLGDLAMGKIKN